MTCDKMEDITDFFSLNWFNFLKNIICETWLI